MKKMKLNIIANVPDNFEPGDCEHCPFSTKTEKEISYHCYETKIKCDFGFTKCVCPMEYIDRGIDTGISFRGNDEEG